MLTHGITPDFRRGVYLLLYDIDLVKSVSLQDFGRVYGGICLLFLCRTIRALEGIPSVGIANTTMTSQYSVCERYTLSW